MCAVLGGGSGGDGGPYIPGRQKSQRGGEGPLPRGAAAPASQGVKLARRAACAAYASAFMSRREL